MLELFGHDIEGVGQFADFGAALDMDALRKISTGNCAAEMSENLQRIRNPAGGENTDADAQGNGHDCQIASVALHLIHAAVGLGARFLHHYGPVQVGHRTVRAEHSYVGVAVADVEFSGRGHHLHLGARLDKIPHDFEVRHILTGRIVRSGTGDQSPLAIHYVWREAASVDLLQASYKELQVHDGTDHAQEAPTVHNRGADQHHGAGRLASSHYKCLTVIDSSFAGGGISALQFALQKCVGSDSAGGNSLGIGIQ